MPRSMLTQSMPEGPGLTIPVAISGLPLAGLTLLTVEDSRFASEALRLLCQRSGARLRRVETMEAAQQHLRVYRPDIIIIDLGLPDGDGTELIADLRGAMRYDGLILAASADPEGRERGLAAGATGFLEKPLESLEGFQNAILGWLQRATTLKVAGQGRVIQPDAQALRDDLAHAADLLAKTMGDDRSYIAQFIRGLARSSHDLGLEEAASDACEDDAAYDGLASALAYRLDLRANSFLNRD